MTLADAHTTTTVEWLDIGQSEVDLIEVDGVQFPRWQSSHA